MRVKITQTLRSGRYLYSKIE